MIFSQKSILPILSLLSVIVNISKISKYFYIHDGRSCEINIKIAWFLYENYYNKIIVKEPDESIQWYHDVILRIMTTLRYFIVR